MIKLREHQAEALTTLQQHSVGIIKAPTGSGKSLIFFEDSKRYAKPGNVICIVASRLNLCDQHFVELDKVYGDIEYVHLMVGTGKLPMRRDNRLEKVQPIGSTTSSKAIADRYRVSIKAKQPLILFSTYDSFNRVLDSQIPVSVVYFDEAHNAVDSDNFRSVKRAAELNLTRYFLTATPKVTESRAVDSSGMNNVDVYGELIVDVPFSDMVEKGYIVPPRLHLQYSDASLTNGENAQADFQSIKENVEHYESTLPGINHKILYCVKGTKTISNLLNKTNLIQWATENGYTVLNNDAKNGGFVDGKKVKNFLELLKEYGEDSTKKLIVLHIKTISEGIDVKGFTAVCFMRGGVDKVFAAQCVGRVVRCAGEWKKYGYVSVVQHKNDSTETGNLLSTLITALLSAGVPIEYLLSEITGSSEDEEVIEDLDKKLKKKIQEISIDWNHMYILDFLFPFTEAELLDSF